METSKALIDAVITVGKARVECVDVQPVWSKLLRISMYLEAQLDVAMQVEQQMDDWYEDGVDDDAPVLA